MAPNHEFDNIGHPEVTSEAFEKASKGIKIDHLKKITNFFKYGYRNQH